MLLSITYILITSYPLFFQVHIIDAKKFSGEVVTKITMPGRVPYGFHGAFMQISFQAQEHNSVYHQQTP